jgi:hypothetical protein
MAQIARPVSDVSVAWLGTPTNTAGSRYTNIDEVTASDADYVRTISQGAVAEFALGALSDPYLSTGHVVRYRAIRFGTGGIALQVDLVQGTTVIASSGLFAPTTSYADYSFTLSGAEADAITDYSDLRLRLTSGRIGPPYTFSDALEVSWAEFEIPDDSPVVSATVPFGLNVEATVGEGISIPFGLAPSANVGKGISVPFGMAVSTSAGGGISAQFGISVSATPGPGVSVPFGITVDAAVEEFEDLSASVPFGISVGVSSVGPGMSVPFGFAVNAAGSPSLSATVPFGFGVGWDNSPGYGPIDPGDGTPGGPSEPPIPAPGRLRHVVLHEFVDVVMAELGWDEGGGCSRQGSFRVPLGMFDFARDGGWREGIDPEDVVLNGPGDFEGQGATEPGTPLYPYWEGMAFAIPTSYSVRRYEVEPGESLRMSESLAMYIARDAFAWRIDGSDDLYPGTVTYPLDAHDDTLLFDYGPSGAALRVCPVPHGSSQPQTLLLASEGNCEREIARFYVRTGCTVSKEEGVPEVDYSVVDHRVTPWIERPIYADGRFGHVCKSWYDCQRFEDECQTRICFTITGRIGGSIFDPAGGEPLVGQDVELLDSEQNHVADGTTDSDGQVCFDVAPGAYSLRICSSCGLCAIYGCLPAGVPKSTYTVFPRDQFIARSCETTEYTIGHCLTTSCLQVIDYDTGAPVDGVPVAGGLADECNILELGESQENLQTTSGGSACARSGLAEVGLIGESSLIIPPLSIRPTGVEHLDSTYVPGPFTQSCGSLPTWADYYVPYSVPEYNYLCGEDDCCDSRTWRVAIFKRDRWTRLLCGCGATNRCGATERGLMVPRTLYARINAPDPIWGGLNGSPVSLYYSGVRRIAGTAVGCRQVWDSGCLSGAGQWDCLTEQFRFLVATPVWDVIGRETRNYGASRLILSVDVGNTAYPSPMSSCSTRLSVLNFFTAEGCASYDPFAVAATGTIPVAGGTLVPGTPGPDCWIPRGPQVPGTIAKRPVPVPIPGTWVGSTPCANAPSGFLNSYPAGVGSNRVGLGLGCSPIPDPCPGVSGGTYSGVSRIGSPVNHSGVLWRNHCDANCAWSIDYEIYE